MLDSTQVHPLDHLDLISRIPKDVNEKVCDISFCKFPINATLSHKLWRKGCTTDSRLTLVICRAVHQLNLALSLLVLLQELLDDGRLLLLTRVPAQHQSACEQQQQRQRAHRAHAADTAHKNINTQIIF